MPKDTSVNSFSVNQSRASPYSCSSENSDLDSKKSLPSVVNKREWEEAKCPICLEHPHNAVLLLCSSRDKGCQPYMCDTSHRHSNCFDQFRKSSAVGAQQGEGNVSGAVFRGESWGQALSGASRSHVQKQPDLTCPLCRGHVEGWIVVKAARNFMNSKTRSCALEACNFSGNYAELRNHARQEHPLERPSEIDPMRQSNWTRLGLQREFEDANAYQTHFEDANAYQTHSVDDFLADLPLDLPLDIGLFDLLDSHYPEAEAGLDEMIDMSLDVELEFFFSFLSESPLVPSVWNWSPSYTGGRSTNRSESGARPQNRRSRRPASDSDNNEQRPTSSRNTNLLPGH
ncbi:uncharacterized protein [Solanum tuberosum]|uniref:Uncharacterized protein n=1 Tax=Solanum tuberosum TaxID=4113 RepID=M1CSJ9_SOLTU|nr:PREDICTED: uncharacterized protein LOC102578632 [Solanum tuberosum]KAH0734509.1 hypothetical protein KY285_010216 [Solanum tuberosum]